MAHDEIIDSWKKPADDTSAPANPAGDALTDDELDVVAGGATAASTEYFLTLGCCPVTDIGVDN